MIVQLVRDVVADRLIGIYRHGSGVLGRLRRFSDLDLLVVTNRELSPSQRRGLLVGLLEHSGRVGEGPAKRPVELISVVQDRVRPWRYPPVRDFLYGEWLRAEFEHGEIPTPVRDPDLAVLLTMVLRGDAPLAGLPPAAVLDPVPPADVRRAMVAGLPELLVELESDTRNVLLTLARIWMTLATGAIAAKDEAAAWALARLGEPDRAPLDHARAAYLGVLEEDWAELDVRATAAALVSRIDQAAAS